MKAATGLSICVRYRTCISIHAAREGGDRTNHFLHLLIFISIHAAREGGDYESLVSASNYDISIHAAREGGDNSEISFNAVVSDFNPRRP